MRKVTTVYEILKDLKRFSNKEIKLAGWVRNNRDQKKFGFINFNDGSAFSGVQIVYADHLENFEKIQKLNVGTSIEVVGDVLLTPNRPQPFEIQAKRITVLGPSDETYPIQPKRHTREFLRENAHLRVRTNLFSAVFRVRSAASFAIHQFFKERNFVYVHTPLITASDGEGAGQMFGVTTLPLDKVPKTKEGEVDYKKDFFGKKTFLTVTGQLQVETYAMAFRNVYTFGPTFRAEHSMTQRHLAEFWMIEPEMAFADLEQMMEVIEDMVKYIINYVMKELPDDMEFFNKYVDNTLFDRLNSVVNSKFAKITHKEAIDILLNSKERFEN
ncbi:MAG: asparagine--tRNA ligase, partial [Acholeplasmatales bacterium]|nr:asparagine--tRNA ligase [Acholeplasmatales bacterium]